MQKLNHSSKRSTNEAARSSLADDFPKLVIDQNAETVRELLTQWPKGEAGLRAFIARKVESGEWEKVFKRADGLFVPAYRRKVPARG